jgi:hypothetical protein
MPNAGSVSMAQGAATQNNVVSSGPSIFTAAQAAATQTLGSGTSGATTGQAGVEPSLSTHAPAATVSTHAVIVPNTKQTATSSGPGMNYAK